MKLWIGFLLPILSLALAHSQSDAPNEQTNFCPECEVKSPVTLPQGALEALRATKDASGEHDVLEQCAKEDGISVNSIPASWFVASEVTVKKGDSPALVVQAKNVCLWGAHIGPFWVLQRSSAGYRIVFSGRADGLDVKETRTNAVRDVELIFALEAGRVIGYSKFCYGNAQYLPCGQHTVQNQN